MGQLICFFMCLCVALFSDFLGLPWVLIANIPLFLKGVVTLRKVATMFDQGAHHPTMLVVLQALLALIGEVTHTHITYIYIGMFSTSECSGLWDEHECTLVCVYV